MRPQQAPRPDLDFEDVKSGFAVGRAAAISDWQFRKEVRDGEKQIAVLRAKKWAKEHPEQRKANVLRYIHKPAVKARQLKQQKARRWARICRERGVFTCEWKRCGAQFCQVPWCAKGPPPRYCSDSHSSMAYAARRTPSRLSNRPYTCGICGETGHSRRSCSAGAKS